MLVKEFLPTKPYTLIESGQLTYSSPSNIALVKYWGKKPQQIPSNSSISFTLDNCKTTTCLKYKPKSSKGFIFEVFLDGQLNSDFKPKIQQFFERILPYVPFLEAYEFIIETSNTFPHSSGIASSASGMSALASCLVGLEQKLNLDNHLDFLGKASFLARLGSGSACRSLDGGLVVWGNHPKILGSTDLKGIPFPYEVHDVFKTYQDTILLIDEGQKQVSSTLGHNLMHNHPFAMQRFEQASVHMQELIPVLKTGDLDNFIRIVETEALSLHAMMMTSYPYFILMKPNTLAAINTIWEYRKTSGIPLCFTLDAGANIHLLYPKLYMDQVRAFIQSDLLKYCQKKKFIHDQVGSGVRGIEN